MALAYDNVGESHERSAKRTERSSDVDALGSHDGHTYGNTTIKTSDMVIMGNYVQHLDQDSGHSRVIAGEDKYNILLKSLLFDRIDFRVNNVRKALFSTCEWLFSHPQFQMWSGDSTPNEHNGFLWIKGKPGCGKSTLMKAALEWARKRKTKDCVRQTIVPYFFNARASALLEKSSLGLYRTVVHHLLSSCCQLRTLFMERFTLKDPGQSGDNWTVEELQEFLYDIVESDESSGLCLFIDALDEAEFEDDVRQMISFLIQLSDRALALGGSCKIQICLSSRHYPHISIGRGLSLVVEDQPGQRRGIETYITKRLTCLDGPEKDDLLVKILNKSARVFLWVVLVVEMLNKLDDYGAPLSDMTARLETIPAGLNELFREILMKSDYGIETSILFFQWTLFRMRPLEPAELFIAMEYSRSPSNPTWVLPAEVSVPPPDRLARYILNCSRGLVEFVEVAPRKPPVIQFIHETVREFLISKNGLASIVPALTTNLVGISHVILRIACLRCISANGIPSGYKYYHEATPDDNIFYWEEYRSGMCQTLPFLGYAVAHLFDHAEQAQQHNISQQAFLETQIDEDGRWLGPHLLWWNVLKQYQIEKVKSGVTLLYFIVERQHSSLVPVLLSASNTANTVCGRFGNALQAASVLDDTEVVQMLLEKGADVNAQGGHYGNALQAASILGHTQVVQILLKKGADVNAQVRHDGNALQAASLQGHTQVVQILLEKGADVNAQGGYYGNALRVASLQGHTQVVQMLLEKGAGISTLRSFR